MQGALLTGDLSDKWPWWFCDHHDASRLLPDGMERSLFEWSCIHVRSIFLLDVGLGVLRSELTDCRQRSDRFPRWYAAYSDQHFRIDSWKHLPLRRLRNHWFVSAIP